MKILTGNSSGSFKVRVKRTRQRIRVIKTNLRHILLKFCVNIGILSHHESFYLLLFSLLKRDIGKDFFFIQIGANDGKRFDPFLPIAIRHNLTGISVEPISYYFAELSKSLQGTNICPLKYAISDQPGRVSMYTVDPHADVPEWAHGIASLNKDHHRDLGIDSGLIREEVVNAITFRDLVERERIDHVDFIIIDAEGYDNKIVSMIPFDLIDPKIIFFEQNISHSSLNEEVTFIDVASMLISRGYRLMMGEHDCIAYK